MKKNKTTNKKEDTKKPLCTSFGENKIARQTNSNKISEFEKCANKGKDYSGNIVTKEHYNFYLKAKEFFQGFVLDLGKLLGVFRVKVTIKADTKEYNKRYGK